MTVLSTTTRLTNELSFSIRIAFDRFAVADLWLTHITLHRELSLHAIDNDIQVQLSHTGNDDLVGFLIRAHAEGWIFLGKFIERHAHLFLILFCFWLNRNGNNWFWEADGLEQDWVIWITQGVTGKRFLESYHGSNFSCPYFRHFFASIGVKSHDTSDTLLATGAGVQDVGTSFHHS